MQTIGLKPIIADTNTLLEIMLIAATAIPKKPPMFFPSESMMFAFSPSKYEPKRPPATSAIENTVERPANRLEFTFVVILVLEFFKLYLVLSP